MESRLRQNDSLRLIGGQDIEDTFIDAKYFEKASDQHFNKCLSVTVFEMHQIFILKKERQIKVFSFRKEDTVYKSDLDWYSDGEVIYTNSKLK